MRLTIRQSGMGRSSGTAVAIVAGVMVWSTLVLTAVYAQPVERRQEIGSGWMLGATGLYAPERNGPNTYVYTSGDTAMRLPEAGAGRFALGIRMAGPATHVPLRVQLAVASQPLDLASVRTMRTYHIFVQAEQPGDVEIDLHSATVRLPSEHRDLGVLLGEIELRSAGGSEAPLPVLIATPVVIAVLAAAALYSRLRRQAGLAASLLLGLATAIPAGYALGRGRMAILPWCIGLALLVGGAAALVRFGERPLRTPILHIAGLFVTWRAILWAAGAIGVWYSATVYRLGQAATWAGAIGPRNPSPWQTLAGAWVQWDGTHYQAIALHGYPIVEQRFPDIAFFPLYSMLTRLALPLAGGNVTIAGLLVSHVALLAGLILAYDLVARDFGGAVAARTLVLLLIFPASLYFGALYSESLGLALLVAALWAIRRERWWLAGAVGFGLALARLPGVMVAPVLALAYLQRHGWSRQAMRVDFLAVLLPPLGLGLFMLYQWRRFGTPLAFMAAQQRWQNHLEAPWHMPLDFISSIIGQPHPEVRVLQLAIWLGFLGLTAIGLLRLPAVYSMTNVLLLTPPYLSSWHESLPRHVLLAFPAFVVMAIYAHRRSVRGAVIAVGLVLLCLATMLYVNGFWVA